MKRIVDLLLGFLLFIFSFPLFVVIFFILVPINRGKPFFIQQRPGKNEKIFKIIKFRTMIDIKEHIEGKQINNVRLTKFGAFLRKFSLDEIPQLINVIKGDMSLVGPRPLLIKYLQHYNEKQRQRHLIKPGMTGWAQINGRNTISWKRKFELDLWYVNNYSFLLDVRIFVITIYKVLLKEGIYSSDNQLVADFNGSN